MLKHTYVILIVFILISSCKTVSVFKNSSERTSMNISLGMLVNEQGSLLEKDIKSVALPHYKNPIKVSITPTTFSKRSYQAFQESKQSQNSSVAVNYVDLIAAKPTFLKIEIVDVLELIESVNRLENTALKSYLENKSNAGIVTGISMAVTSQCQQDLLQADEVFLEPNGMKSYALKGYKDKELKQTFMFDRGVIFAFKTSGFCWQQDAKYELQIIDVTESKCSKGSYKNSKRTKKERDYLKF